MTRDKNKSLSLNENNMRSVIFCNDAPWNIKKKVGSLDNGNGKYHKVLFVKGLKHNLLSGSQMCNQGYDVAFWSKCCEIKLENTREVIEKGVSVTNNVYTLKKEMKIVTLEKFMRVGYDTRVQSQFKNQQKLSHKGFTKDYKSIQHYLQIMSNW